MIRVRVRLVNGCLKTLESEGHAPAEHGTHSAPCAVVSTMCAALGRTLLARPDIVVEGAADAPGAFRLRVVHTAPGALQYVAGITDAVVAQLRLAASEYPADIDVHIDEEQIDGTQKRWWQFQKRS